MSGAEGRPKPAPLVNVEDLRADVFRMTGVKIGETDPVVAVALLNQRLAEALAERMAELAARVAVKTSVAETIRALGEWDGGFVARFNVGATSLEGSLARIVGDAEESLKTAVAAAVREAVARHVSKALRVRMWAGIAVAAVVCLWLGYVLASVA